MLSCERCYKYHRKCNKQIPCNQCTKLGIECMPRKPTKITDKIAKKRKCDSLREGEGCEQKVLDALSKRQKIKKNDDHAGIIFLIKDWVSGAVRRRSVALMAKAFQTAKTAGIHMDKILSAPNGNMSHIPTLLLNPEKVTKDRLLGPRIMLRDIPEKLREAVFGPENKTVKFAFARKTCRGLKRYYFTHDFEETYVTDDARIDFCKIRPCWRPVFDHVDSHALVIKAIGEAYASCKRCKTVSTQWIEDVKVARLDGMFDTMNLRLGLYIESPVEATLCFALFDPIEKDISNLKLLQEAAVDSCCDDTKVSSNITMNQLIEDALLH